MAKVGNSIFDIQGKLGDLVYYHYRGRKMVRKAPPKRTTNCSQSQSEHRAKFAFVANFLRPLDDFLKRTCKIYNRNKTSYQKAFSEIYKNAVTGTHPSYSLDYNKVWLGNGSLHNAFDTKVESTTEGRLLFTWSDNDSQYDSKSSDQLFVAIYCEKLNRWFYQFDCAERCKNNYETDLTFFSGTQVQVYMGFMSVDKKKVSTPLYTGELDVL